MISEYRIRRATHLGGPEPEALDEMDSAMWHSFYPERCNAFSASDHTEAVREFEARKARMGGFILPPPDDWWW